MPFGGRQRGTGRSTDPPGGAEQPGRRLGFAGRRRGARQPLQGQRHGAYVTQRPRGRQSFGVQGPGTVRVPPQFGGEAAQGRPPGRRQCHGGDPLPGVRIPARPGRGRVPVALRREAGVEQAAALRGSAAQQPVPRQGPCRAQGRYHPALRQRLLDGRVRLRLCGVEPGEPEPLVGAAQQRFGP
ncbi:hypothetical protein [Streptomyces sp. MJM1172]|uniref:hypothetical protein n=1 Tax=Streptomyces sp. MJM1172 TaxID=1703926 RepID=UPI0009393CC9|nr:hypothetical protein [Streptomyces sp. MJM1172]OKI62063.1 hypothetical protein AMK15_17845 [Streptomyces sp. MJM1172]